MKLFSVKEDNTVEALTIALNRAKEINSDLVVATTTGKTGLKALEMARESGFSNKLVLVTHCYGSGTKGENRMPEEVRAHLKEGGAVLVTAAHALSAGERGISSVYKGTYPLEIIAQTLRSISAGTKVAYEIALMACDAGEIGYQKPTVCVGGTGKGADTVCVITPSYSSAIFETKINEILAKPDLY